MTPAEQYRKLVNRLVTITESPDDPDDLGQLDGWELVDGPLPDEAQGLTAVTPATPDPAKPAVTHTAEQRAVLKNHCEYLLDQLSVHADPWSQQILNRTGIVVPDHPPETRADRIYSYAKFQEIVVDYDEFHDAPDDVLLFLLGHEAGHVVLYHRGKVDPKVSQQQELDADRFATQLLLSMGINRVPAFEWLNRKKNEQGKTFYQDNLDDQRDPANAEWYRDQASHPTYDRRFKAAADQGLELSQPNTDQIDNLLAHMSRVSTA
jgi:hypothetical protein